MATLLIVDDEPNVVYSLTKRLASDSLHVLGASTAKQAVEMVGKHNPDAVLLDVRLPDMSGLEAFDRIRRIDPRLPVVIITAHATTETAIEAMKQGAFEYLVKPLDLRQLQEIVSRAIHLSRLSRTPAVFDQGEWSDTSVDRIVGLSLPMQQVYKDIGRAAPQDVNVLILGESGTGKELVARAIYSHSRRSQQPFLAINCAAIPETLLESELFGHERGAFTGAERRRIGKFEQADRGTVFLDEIGDMSMATQAKILRLLQDGRFDRVGGNETIQTNVRVIAATNQDLQRQIGEGRFREDLYYRLKVFTIQLPPLRERMEDLTMLVEHFTRLFSRELGKSVGVVLPETMEILEAYDWLGNVRELQSAIKYALVQATGEFLTPQLPAGKRSPSGEGSEHPPCGRRSRSARYPAPAAPADRSGRAGHLPPDARRHGSRPPPRNPRLRAGKPGPRCPVVGHLADHAAGQAHLSGAVGAWGDLTLSDRVDANAILATRASYPGRQGGMDAHEGMGAASDEVIRPWRARDLPIGRSFRRSRRFRACRQTKDLVETVPVNRAMQRQVHEREVQQVQDARQAQGYNGQRGQDGQKRRR